MAMLCPRCLSVVSGAAAAIDERNRVCPGCNELIGGGMLLHSQSVRELESLPAWASRTEAPGLVSVRIRAWQPASIAPMVFLAFWLAWMFFLIGPVHGHPMPCWPVCMAPFVLWGAMLFWFMGLPTIGSIRIERTPDRLTIVQGIGWLGQRWTLDPRQVRGVRRVAVEVRRRGGRYTYWRVDVYERYRVEVGWRFPDERVAFMQAVLWELIGGTGAEGPAGIGVDKGAAV